MKLKETTTGSTVYDFASQLAKSLGKYLPVVVILLLVFAGGVVVFVQYRQLNIELANQKAEISNQKTELANQKVEIANQKRDADIAEGRSAVELEKMRSERDLIKTQANVLAANQTASAVAMTNETALHVSSVLQKLIEGQLSNASRIQSESEADFNKKKMEFQKSVDALRKDISALEVSKFENQKSIYQMALSEIDALMKNSEQFANGLPVLLSLLHNYLGQPQIYAVAVGDLKDSRLDELTRFRLALEMYLVSHDNSKIQEARALIEKVSFESGYKSRKATIQRRLDMFEKINVARGYGQLYIDDRVSDMFKMDVLVTALVGLELPPNMLYKEMGEDLYSRVLEVTGELFLKYSKRPAGGYYSYFYCRDIGDALYKLAVDRHQIFLAKLQDMKKSSPDDVIDECLNSQPIVKSMSFQKATH